MEYQDLTNVFYKKLLEEEQQKSPFAEKHRKTLIWLNENGNSIIKANDGHCFLFQDIKTCSSNVLNPSLRIPRYARESIYEILGIIISYSQEAVKKKVVECKEFSMD